MASESAGLISSEKTPLISTPEGEGKGAIPKSHGSIEQPQPAASIPPIIVTNTSTPLVIFGPKAQLVTCPNCKSQVRTNVKYRANVETHWMALLLLILCCPCICLPYCCNSCKVAHHYCPKCRQYLGRYR